MRTLKATRLRAEYGRGRLAREAGIYSQMSIWRYETGRVKTPALKHALGISRVLGVKPSEIAEFAPVIERAVAEGVLEPGEYGYPSANGHGDADIGGANGSASFAGAATSRANATDDGAKV